MTELKPLLEQVFKTEGVPPYTFVEPPNYNEILIDVRAVGKPIVIEGQSGTGKTTVIKHILSITNRDHSANYWTMRDSRDRLKIEQFATQTTPGVFIIDDFHRLSEHFQELIANHIKAAAESDSPNNWPKIIILGINKVGGSLIQLAHDVGKRLGVHRIKHASMELATELLRKGENILNIEISNKELIYAESKGDYWLTQLIAKTICINNGVTEQQIDKKQLSFTIENLRVQITEKLSNSYSEPVKVFCRGNRFRPTNDPYYKLLVAISKQDTSVVDLTELANANSEVRGSINNIKDKRLGLLLSEKAICAKYFYYNHSNTCFAIEDPALFYYIKNVNWEEIKRECGFRAVAKEYKYDYAISFAGENRDLARTIAEQLEMLDASVFYDENYEINFLGKAWRDLFRKIFSEECRYVVCILDEYHDRKIWPTFERECFTPRVKLGDVIPIFLDETKIVGISRDTIGIVFDVTKSNDPGAITDEITFKLIEKLSE